METWALRPASHLARSLLRQRIDQENLPPTNTDPLLLVVTPPVSAPATNRARTLRKDISSLQTGVAAVRQAYDGRPVRSRRRLLRFPLGGVGHSLHLYSLPWVRLPHRCQAATLSSILYNLLQLYHQEAQGLATLRLGLRVMIGTQQREKRSRVAESRSPRAPGPSPACPSRPPPADLAEEAVMVFTPSALPTLL
jgi:hypothetical protein